MSRTTVVVALMMAVCGGLLAAGSQRAAQPNCVTIATPSPAKIYTYQHTDSSGAVTRTTQQWERVDATGFRERVTTPAGVQIKENEHHIVDDVSVIDRTSTLNANGKVIDATTFVPGIVGDPAFRACAGKSWPIPRTTATYNPGSHKATTPVGTLTIVAIREKITVPAGTFDTVHYKRTSQSIDEYWKSTAEGVIVKHVGSVQGGGVTEVLQSIK
ncbi:MAG TPA: hypothetical protein VFV78_01300 [Vicinamibacterales bacterium]|nr:hypothetical protein [Vicinamibacterales bacterium]